MYSQEKGAGTGWGMVDLGQGKLISCCFGSVLGIRGPALPLFSGQKVTEKGFEAGVFHKALSQPDWLLSLCPFGTAIGVLVPWWSKGRVIFGWL